MGGECGHLFYLLSRGRGYVRYKEMYKFLKLVMGPSISYKSIEEVLKATADHQGRTNYWKFRRLLNHLVTKFFGQVKPIKQNKMSHRRIHKSKGRRRMGTKKESRGRQLFNLLSHGRGRMTFGETYDFLRLVYGPGVSFGDLEAAVKAAAAGGDGDVPYARFRWLLEEVVLPDAGPSHFFKALRTTKGEVVSFDDWKRYMVKHGTKDSDDEILEILSFADRSQKLEALLEVVSWHKGAKGGGGAQGGLASPASASTPPFAPPAFVQSAVKTIIKDLQGMRHSKNKKG